MTLIDSYFICIELEDGVYDDNGEYQNGSLSSKQIQGTIQPMKSKEALNYSNGARSTGFVKVISSEKLKIKERDKSGSYVRKENEVYLLESEEAHSYLIPHYVYVGNIVPASGIPSGVKSALGL